MSAISATDIQHLKQSVDLLSLAERYTDLRKIARREWQGPCPRCGGTKRFHVHADGWWFCRDCHEQRGDVIEFVRFVDGCDFITACEQLSNRTLRLPAPRPQRAEQAQKPTSDTWRTERWQTRAHITLNEAATALDSDAGAPGRAYLQQRGITQHTWRCWLVGYAPTSPPWDKEQQRRVGGASIVMPYLRFDNDNIMALRYRRIAGDDRYINEWGSNCVLYGLHQLDERAHTLVIVEGELNCISIWQEATAHDLGICVVSVGSQSLSEQTLSAVAWLSKRYQRCIAWCDTPAQALKLRAAVHSPTVLPLQSPKIDGVKYDANDLLQQGLLSEFLARKLAAVDVAEQNNA